MKLKSIRALGFKSFADKMEMEFKTPITAIVGPNGSGKSNIVDAIRWVLGEQSVKSLRGGGAMSDVIFAGSETRAPFKRAEVSLTFDNTSMFLNTSLTEVEVKRVLYYTGENEYYINNTKVRLKDITNLFLDSGLGMDSFNIISQGNIEAIVNAKPVERRYILESAAGVLKYRTRKNESLRKLEKTRDNLEKVELVIEELKTQVIPLKEQSEVAKKYLEYKSDLENKEIALTTYDITNLNKRYEEIDKIKASLNEKKEKSELKNTKEITLVEQLKTRMIHVEDDINKYSNDLILVNEELAKLNGEKMMLQERQSYEVSHEKVNNEYLKLQEEKLNILKRKETLESELTTLTSTLNNLENKKRDIEEKISIFNVKFNRHKNEMERLNRDIYSLQNKKDILENNILEDASVPYAVKNVLSHPRLKGIHNTIGKLLNTKDIYLNAIDVTMGASSNFIVVDNESCAKEAIKYLKEQGLGRATFFPLNVIKGKEVPKSVIDSLKNETGFIDIASHLVEFEPTYKDIIENQLGNVLVAKDIDAMNRIGKSTGYRYRVVTLDGEIMHTGGSLTGGSLKKQTSTLKLKSDLATTEKDLELVKENMTILQKKNIDFLKEQEDNNTTNESITREIISLSEKISQKKILVNDIKKEEENISIRLDGAQSIITNDTEKQMLSLLNSIKDKEIIKENLNNKLSELKSTRSDISSEINALDKEISEKNSEYHKILNEIHGYELETSKMDTKMDYLLNLLNETYHMTYEHAKREYTLDIASDIARESVSSLRKAMNRLGDVNIGSIKEYERVNERYTFLTSQKNDLDTSIADLLEIIKEMDEIMISRLTEAYEKISDEFERIFKKMFKGGSGKIKLTDPDNILETGIDIIAEPPGKKLNHIALLSGGEKTLTAISLLFAILNVYPVPFCVLDEVEAALDEANVDTFGKYLQEQEDKSEFILITHKKRTMEYAKTLYGITMQEQGVSKIVKVKLEDGDSLNAV